MADTLEITKASVSYSGVEAIRDVSLSVPAGKCIGVLGANGAGKTTLLRVISGLEPIKGGGRISLFDTRIDDWSASRRAKHGLGHVLEGRHIFPHLTVRENLEVGGIAQGLARDRMRENLERALSLLPELTELLGRAGGSLSGGQQQFLAVARALILSPKIILLDEPTVGLAPRMVERMVDIVQGLKQAGIGVLLVEQRISVVKATADRVHVLVHGDMVGDFRADDPEFEDKTKAAYFA
jgi:ABC-type branched-subunit amino acid transport system ATPase component